MNQEKVWQALRQVLDPELGIDIVSLGLIYEVNVSDDNKQIYIKMTLTTPGCPLAPEIDKMVKEAVKGISGLESYKTEIDWTFEPPWHQGMISEEAKASLGLV